MTVNNGTDGITLNDINFKFQLDTAADVNTIYQWHVTQHRVSTTTVCRTAGFH